MEFIVSTHKSKTQKAFTSCIKDCFLTHTATKRSLAVAYATSKSFKTQILLFFYIPKWLYCLKVMTPIALEQE